MPQVEKRRVVGVREKLVIIAVAILAVVVIVAGGVYLSLQGGQPKSTAEARYQEVFDRVARLSMERKYAEARDLLESYVPEAKGDRLCRAQLTIGALSTTLKDYPTAKKGYQGAIDIQGCNELGAIQGLALASEQAGEKDEAIGYYRKLIELWPADDPDKGSEIESARSHIVQLGGQL